MSAVNKTQAIFEISAKWLFSSTILFAIISLVTTYAVPIFAFLFLTCLAFIFFIAPLACLIAGVIDFLNPY